MSKYICDTSEGLRRVQEVGDYLEDLAGAFYKTGNTQMAGDLRAAVRELKAAHNQIDNAIGEELNRRVGQAEEASTNMVRACLNVLGNSVKLK